MLCPGCDFRIEREDAWICPSCNKVLDASKLMSDLVAPPTPVWGEDTTNVAVDGHGIEARIVDNITIDESFQGDEDVAMITGFDLGEDGHISSVAYYSAGTSRVIRPDAVPRTTPLADETIGTPYQERVLDLIDGLRDVRAISRESQLTPRDVAVALLSLFDDGLIELEGIEPVQPSDDLVELDDHEFEEVPSLVAAPPPRAASPVPPPVLSADYLLELAVPEDPGPPPEVPRLAEPSPLRAPVKRRATTPYGRRAEALYEKALKDRDAGNLVSAQMNIKLALTFEPKNDAYRTVLSKITAEVEASGAINTASREDQAKELAARATDRENAGDIDEAVELLDRAVGLCRQPRLMNRLGVLIAMRQGRLQPGRKWIAEAVSRSPRTHLYEKNLIKVDRAIEAERKKEKRKSLLGLFGRAKK